MIKRLFILGNGFDLSHGLETKYTDFEKWVSNRNKRLHEKITFMMEELNKIVENLEDNLNWSDFEKSFHELIQGGWGEFFIEESIQNFLSNPGDPNFSDADRGALEYELKEKLISLSTVKSLFNEWILLTIEPTVKQHSPRYVFGKEDIFFSFNYTTTLETIYKIKKSNIYHIHGDYKNVIVGHNEKFEDNFSKEYNPDDDNIMLSDAMDRVSLLHENLSKDVNKQIIKFEQSTFFSELRTVNKVHVIGHGYGKYDYPYYELLAKAVSNYCTWNFYYHSEEDFTQLTKLLKILPDIRYETFNCIPEVFD
ncbi:bacteriophage abortive infection AbiH family protein [Enterococcus faecalis]